MKPIASLSLDLDNEWSYLKTHGDAEWAEFPSYFSVVVPRILEFLQSRSLKITVFVVGQDAALSGNAAPLRSLADAGHEIGNHSFNHEPWLHLYSEDAIAREIAEAEENIERVTGSRPIGFRGPGFSFSGATLRVLAQRGYLYDASTLPTFIGPLARAYYFMKSRLNKKELQQRDMLFGNPSDGLRPNKPYRWEFEDGELLEIPVTTMPGLRLPIHASYVIYLAAYSRALAMAYFGFALQLCKLTKTQPSLLLHPLDFMGVEDNETLAFFPGMSMPRATKLAVMGEIIDTFAGRFDVVTMKEHASHILRRSASQIRALSPA
ncbi:MAG: polysaccharide deacetylase [Candidatus Eremiobacter antarcticus]|nr:polysaccharide deacetylase family protein [Candidatus Eremiobacteraeota bacterium]MBC5808992.1 polysaccharide deacetylase family protein [Candidatus Eremiobacteraeota bacterium]PZR60333.1 MAG: polysaccharide deacetylase [Candidatus Eremiobacter sp. RRmetagenome_bin22]